MTGSVATAPRQATAGGMSLVLLLMAAPAQAHTPVTWIVLAGDPDWCQVIADADGGDQIFLSPGRYEGPCAVDLPAALYDNEQTVIGSLDPADQAVITAPASDVPLELTGARVVVRQLVFEDVEGADALRLVGLTQAWVRESLFRRVVGRAVVAEAVEDLHVVDTRFEGVDEALIVGAVDGSGPVPMVGTLWNVGHDVGVGVRVAAGTGGTLSDDTWTGVRDVGIEVAGGGAEPLNIDRVLVQGARGVDIADGPVWLRSSVVVGETLAVGGGGPSATEVVLAGNSLLGPNALDDWGPDRGLQAIGNAVDAALPDVGAELVGNVVCGGVECYVDRDVLDLFPPVDSPLRGGGVDVTSLTHDWCNRARKVPPAAGAIEGYGPDSFGPLPTEERTFTPCGVPGTTLDTGVVFDTGGARDTGPSDSDSPDGSGGGGVCGCEARPSSSPIGVGLATWLVRRRVSR